MTHTQYRDTLSWQAAIDLARPLTRLIEELPAQEGNGLIMTIQSLMVELPAAIALDLVKASNERHAMIFRLQAALEIIDGVYPALDTAEPREALEQLVARTESSQFTEVKAAPVTLVVDDDEADVVSDLVVGESSV